MPSTRPLLYNWSADLLLAPPFSGDSVGGSAVASGPFDFAFKRDGSSDGPCTSSVRPNFRRCVFMQIASLPVLRRGSFPFCQRCFSSVVFPALFLFFQLCIGFHRLTFLSCRYVEIAAFFVSSFTGVSTSPGLIVLGPPGSVDRSSDYGVASVFFFLLCLHMAKVWTE